MPAVTLPQGRNGLSVRRMAVLSTFRAPSLCRQMGLDHGAGHSLLLLCDAKASRGKNSMKFKGLGDDLFNVFISLF